jgi:glycosyltransferase involved in cell wall biosynthesis
MNDDGNRALFISYAYPPSSAPGSVRVTRLVTRLPSHDWRPFILTVGSAIRRSTGSSDPFDGDHYRVNRIDDPIAVAIQKSPSPAGPKGGRTSSLLRRLAEHLIFPDRTIFWALRLKQAKGWARNVNPKIIHSTSPSLATHFAAKAMVRATGAKWVAEFRDPSSWLPRNDKTPALKRWLLAKAEAHIVNRADAIVVISEAFAEYFRGRYPGRPIHSIPNGAEFSEADLTAAMARRTARRNRSKEVPFVLVHAGELYGGARNPEPLIRAAQIAQERLSRPLLLRFLGADSHIAGDAARKLGADKLVEVVGPLCHADSVLAMQDADGLVALLHDDPVGRIGIMSKFFDYAASANPVLVVGEKVAMLSRIVEEHSMGIGCEYSDITGMANWMAALANAPQDFDYDCISVCRHWSADAMAASMARLFEALV